MPREDELYNKVPAPLRRNVDRTYKLTKEIKKVQALSLSAPSAVQSNCANPGKCRVWGACGQTTDALMIDGVSQGCIDAYRAVNERIDYCGHFLLAQGGRSCSYQDATTKTRCICP